MVQKLYPFGTPQSLARGWGKVQSVPKCTHSQTTQWLAAILRDQP